MEINNYSKGTVLITGASSGIGSEMAEVFAKDGYNLILIARNIEALQEKANKLREKNHISIFTFAKDLARITSAQEIYDEVNALGIEVDILINNAGFGTSGLFHETNLNKYLEEIQVNLISLTSLTRLFVEDMVKRKRGKIMNVASTGAFMPGPLFSVYYGSKAYVLSFSEALANELRPYGITVSALCPGAVKTGFQERAGKTAPKEAMDAKTVALVGYTGLVKGKRVIVPGFIYKVLTNIPRFLPRETVTNISGRLQEKQI